jgi:hypothetical protein
MATEDPTLVIIQCVQQGSRLRMKILSEGYINGANCQMSRSVREAGKYYTVHEEDVRLVAARGRHFYRVSDAHIKKYSSMPSILKKTTSLGRTRTKSKSKQGDDTEEPAAKRRKGPAQVFCDEGNVECIICMDRDRQVIFVECGHYYCCQACYDGLREKNCPVCKQRIKYTIKPSEVDV